MIIPYKSVYKDIYVHLTKTGIRWFFSCEDIFSGYEGLNTCILRGKYII